MDVLTAMKKSNHDVEALFLKSMRVRITAHCRASTCKSSHDNLNEGACVLVPDRLSANENISQRAVLCYAATVCNCVEVEWRETCQ
jgi:hypothetical protein